MAEHKSVSGIFKKLGNKLVNAHNKHAGDETTFSGFGELPAGIENGIAQLVDIKFDKYKEGNNVGEYYFYARGVVHKPTEHEGMKVEGLSTSIMEPVHDTPERTRKTVEDHISWVYNELRKLGVDTTEVDPTNLEATFEALLEGKPYFRFRTWKGQPTEKYPNPRTNHQWNGVVEYDPEADGSDVEDNSEDVKGSKGSKPATAPAKSKVKETVEEEDTDENSEESSEEGASDLEFGDLASLAKKADKGDKVAHKSLMEQFKKLGITEKKIKSFETFSDLIKSLNKKANEEEEEEGSDEGEEGGEEEEAKEAPEVGQIFKFFPINKETKKREKKAIDVEITAVSDDGEKVDFKEVGGKRVFKGVAVSNLS